MTPYKRIFCFTLLFSSLAGFTSLAHRNLAFAVEAHGRIASGLGSYTTQLPSGAKTAQAEIFKTENVTGPMPTNDWWSSVAWLPFSERHYPHPLAVQAVEAGLAIHAPGSEIHANEHAIFGFMPVGPGVDLTLGHSGVEKFTDARVDGFSDWFVSVRFAKDGKNMCVTYGHGSPFVFADFSGGTAQLHCSESAEVFAGDSQSATLGITIRGKSYGLFAPRGARWEGLGSKTLTVESPQGYFTVGLLPQKSPAAALRLFEKYAHAHVTDSRVGTRFDPATSQVETTFLLSTKSREGEQSGSLLALYPHQWRNLAGSEPLAMKYASVRGEMKLVAAESFRTEMAFPGVLPSLPVVASHDRGRLASLLQTELQQAEANVAEVKDTYWDGKQLGKLATLLPLAEQLGEEESKSALLAQLKLRLERWLDASSAQRLFYYDRNWGTLIGYPASFGSDVELNDHHFHYGYFLRAAAEVARHDPDWADDARWGGMLRLLARDIASTDRNDPLFPWLRNFDPYAGHSWASGHAKFGDGNNNESSSEAMNAWYGLILLGQATGDMALRDLGIYLYTTEMKAIQEYWFDVRDENHPAGFTPSVVTMVWGGKGANGTWFSSNPEVVHGINWLPLHGGSLYLGQWPEYVRRNFSALVAENQGTKWDEWADLVMMYQALADPATANAQFAASTGKYAAEGGNSQANAYHWLTTFAALGQVERRVTADYPLTAVFTRPGSDNEALRTYVVYNDARQMRMVTFSDGVRLDAAPRSYTMKEQMTARDGPTRQTEKP